MAPRGRSFDDDETLHGEGEGEYCETCKQEYLGHCPIRSSKCPFENEDGGDEDEDEPGRDGDDE